MAIAWWIVGWIADAFPSWNALAGDSEAVVVEIEAVEDGQTIDCSSH